MTEPSNKAKWGMAAVVTYFGLMIGTLVVSVSFAIIKVGAGWPTLGVVAAVAGVVALVRYVMDRHDLWRKL